MDRKNSPNEELIKRYERCSLDVKNKLRNISKEYLQKNTFITCDFNFVFDKRLEKNKLLRPFLCLLTYESIFNEKYSQLSYEKVLLPLMVTTELFNISTYQTNYAFDDKITNKIEISKENQTIYSFLTLGIAENIINALNVSTSIKIKILNLLNKENHSVYLGQHIDLNQLSMKNYNEIIRMKDKDFFNKYYLRCEYLGGSTIRYSMLSSYYGFCIEKDSFGVENLEKIATTYGALMQFLNDLADYMEEMQDLKMGKITYPIYCTIKEIQENNNKEQVVDIILNLTTEQKRRILVKYSIDTILRKKYSFIIKEFNKVKVLRLSRRYSIMYETIFRGHFYKKIFID